RLGAPVECQVVEADVDEETEAVRDLLDDLRRDLLAPAFELQFTEELERAADGQGADRGKRRAADENESRRYREPRAVALRAAARAEVARELLAHGKRLGLVVAPLEVREDPLELVRAPHGAPA